jgi:hypothetical protein
MKNKPLDNNDPVLDCELTDDDSSLIRTLTYIVSGSDAIVDGIKTFF